MNIILWVVFGAIVGWITSIIMSTDQHRHYVAGSLLGIAGGLLGGFAMQQLADNADGLNLYSLITAVGFALLVVSFYSIVHLNRTRHY